MDEEQGRKKLREDKPRTRKGRVGSLNNVQRKRPAAIAIADRSIKQLIDEAEVVHEHEHTSYSVLLLPKVATGHYEVVQTSFSQKSTKTVPTDDTEVEVSTPVLTSIKERSFATHVTDYVDEIISGGQTNYNEHQKLHIRHNKIAQELENAPSWFRILLYFMAMGVITALIGLALEITINRLRSAHYLLMNLADSIYLKGFVWIIYMLFLVLFSVTFTHLVSSAAAGSGIPQIKTILSGVQISGFFTKRTFIAKVIGLATFLGSGMVAGKEGALIHLAVIVSHQLANFDFFEKLFRGDNGMRDITITAATALGMAATFGAPVAGVMFTIEVTSVYYATRTYWFAAGATVTSSLVFRTLWNVYLGNGQPMLPFIAAGSTFDDGSWSDIVAVFIFAVFLGPVGCLFSYSINRIITLKRFVTSFSHLNPLLITYLWSILGVILTGILTFPGIFPFLSLTSGGALQELINPASIWGTMENKTTSLNFTESTTGVLAPLESPNWIVSGSAFLGLFLFILIRLPLQVIAFSIPAPGGIYYPIAALGAALGRLLGEALNLWFPGKVASPAVYALVGAGALPGAVTGAVSTAIILVELTGDSNALLLVVTATIISVYTSGFIYDSVYIVIQKLQGLPYMPDLVNTKYSLTGAHLSEPVYFLEQMACLKDLTLILQHYKKNYTNDSRNFHIPIVTETDTPILIGAVYYHVLDKFVQKFSENIRHEKKSASNMENVKFDVLQCMAKIIHGIPVQFTPETSILEIHRAFILSHLSCAFITKRGQLVGMITRSRLKQVISKKIERKGNPVNQVAISY